MIYFFDSYDTFNAEKFENFLPEKRNEKYRRFRQKRDRENCLVSYLILKQILYEKGIENFEIFTDENGKPFLKNIDLFFSISHCKLGVAVSVSHKPTGIDIQDIEPYSEGICKRMFSDGEINNILSSDDRDRAFTRLWTLKEAAAKCDGKGLAVMKDFSFENCEKNFTKYGRNFSTFEKENLFISVCGNEEFSDIIEIKNWEVFLNENFISG